MTSNVIGYGLSVTKKPVQTVFLLFSLCLLDFMTMNLQFLKVSSFVVKTNNIDFHISSFTRMLCYV